jgi:cbb3-type cytochrome oxidase maturation protein
MITMLYLIPLALFVGLLGVIGFFWLLRHNQYEDLKGAAERILLDDDQEIK